ncbi:DUF3280 domain-containing protein [Roseibium aggregatum]|uniref:DUF3280 domain-containing protein n=1 Tax=Roseibium aggregatum TaxID=187304 RepID=A0A926NX37_9HYPH|nr:DUF3280 domain-containing protein [Roseibium aggregatum]MBD1545388.1 DUF3280 domain-containing protein [Roseibium aggregatum]
MRPLLTFAVLLVLTVPSTANEFVPGSKVAFLGLTFLDTSTEGAYNGVRADETERLALLNKLIEDRFKKEGMVLVDLSPISKKLENRANLASCHGCDVRMAETLGADFVLVGLVQKVSNLILSMKLVLRDVETGKDVRARVVDIRSNTDQSWTRGMNYILKTAFFKE